MDDNGEPGKADQIVALIIWDESGQLVLNINPGELDVTTTAVSGTAKDPFLVSGNQTFNDEGKPWLDLETGNQQWTPHPFKSHGPTNTNPCEELGPVTGLDNPLDYNPYAVPEP